MKPRLLVFSVLSAVYQFSKHGPVLPSPALAESLTVWLSLSFGTTLICTALIVYRLLCLTRTVTPGVWNCGDVIEVMIESALLYSLALLIFVALIIDGSYYEMYPEMIVAQMTVGDFRYSIVSTELTVSSPTGYCPNSDHRANISWTLETASAVYSDHSIHHHRTQQHVRWHRRYWIQHHYHCVTSFPIKEARPSRCC